MVSFLRRLREYFTSWNETLLCEKRLAFSCIFFIIIVDGVEFSYNQIAFKYEVEHSAYSAVNNENKPCQIQNPFFKFNTPDLFHEPDCFRRSIA